MIKKKQEDILKSLSGLQDNATPSTDDVMGDYWVCLLYTSDAADE